MLEDFTLYSHNIGKFLKVINEVSKTMAKIHRDPHKIILGDVNFKNILFDAQYNCYFLDYDSYGIDGLPTTTLGSTLTEYVKERGITFTSDSYKGDILQLYIDTFEYIFNCNLARLPMAKYDLLSEQINSLYNLKEYLLIILHAVSLPTLPYIHEVLDPADFKVACKMPVLTR